MLWDGNSLNCLGSIPHLPDRLATEAERTGAKQRVPPWYRDQGSGTEGTSLLGARSLVSGSWRLHVGHKSPRFLNTLLGAALPVTMVAFKGLCTRVLSVMPRELVAPCKTPLAPFPRALVRLLTCRGEERTVSVAAALLSIHLESPVSSHPASNPFE